MRWLLTTVFLLASLTPVVADEQLPSRPLDAPFAVVKNVEPSSFDLIDFREEQRTQLLPRHYDVDPHSFFIVKQHLGIAGGYDNGIAHVYVMLPSREAVAALRPDLAGLAALTTNGVNVFAGDGERWKTRMFAPANGVPEDAATGSAAGPLAWHLARHGRVAYGDTIRIEQGAEIGRPSLLYARAHERGDAATIEVGGSAVTVARGEFRLHR